MSQFEDLPRVDVQKLMSTNQSERSAELEKIKACVFNLGVVVITNTGIDTSKIELGQRVMRTLFALPEEVKNGYADADIGYQEGYGPWGVENAKGSEEEDKEKEFWHVKGDRLYPRVDPEGVDGFEIFFELFEIFEQLGINMLEAIGEIIGRKPGYYRDMVTGGDTLLRLLHYKKSEEKDVKYWAYPHKDIGLCTILIIVEGGALYIRAHDGTEFRPALKKGEIVIQIGDTLQEDSIGHKDEPMLVSTEHWVENDGEPAERYSMPCFIHPKPETPINGTTSNALLNERLGDIGLKEHAT